LAVGTQEAFRAAIPNTPMSSSHTTFIATAVNVAAGQRQGRYGGMPVP